MAWIECVPNFSEGRDAARLERITGALDGVPGAFLLDVERDADHNRSVVTFVARPEAVVSAGVALLGRAIEEIDLNRHQGQHPRMGACDVFPLIPLSGVTTAQCVDLCHALGRALAETHALPCYLYEDAAQRPERQNLAKIRKKGKLNDVKVGAFEWLRAHIPTDDDRIPDYGPRAVHPTAGITAIGTRFFLIAYNVNLETTDLALAKSIAARIRERDGGLPGIKAMGFELADQGCVQVSMNVVDYRKTSLVAVYRRIAALAAEAGAGVRESELVGLVPQDAIDTSFAQATTLPALPKRQIIENRLHEVASADPMGGFVPFLDAVASKSPTPGGGSVSALAAALGAALGEMVANLTAGKKKYAAVEAQVVALGDRLATARAELIAFVARDAAAYDAVSAAMKLPKATDSEQTARRTAIQAALRTAAEVPLACARACAALLEALATLAPIGNRNAVTDCGVGALLANAAAHGCLYNVRINLGGIKDEQFVAETRAAIAALTQQLATHRDAALSAVDTQL